MDLGLRVVCGVPEEGRVVPIPRGSPLVLGRYGGDGGIGLTLTSRAINR